MIRWRYSHAHSSYLCLAHIPLELDDDNLVHLKMDLLSWLHLLDEDFRIAPPYSYGRDSSLWQCLHISMITMMMASFKHMISSRWIILILHFISSYFIMLMSWRDTWYVTSSYSSRHTCYRLNHLMTNLWMTLWITHWSSLDLLISTLTPTYGSSIDYGQNLRVKLNANISL